MEAASFHPHPGLQQTLKQFHLSSMRSLGGPAAFSARWHQELLFTKDGKAAAAEAAAGGAAAAAAEMMLLSLPAPQTGPPPVLPGGPLFIPSDRSTERCETVLEREPVSCFVVGGEKRLCLPQILNTVLRDFSLQQINAVCDDLHIYCSRCTADQLEILKVVGILPFSAPSCGLITQTDAERLCNALIYGGSYPPHSNNSNGGTHKELELERSEKSFKVYHECFGRCEGLFVPELYRSPGAACIQCLDCRLMYPPHKFVVHSHKRLENRTVHWGFDSANWRAYVLLDPDYAGTEEKARLERLLRDLKRTFDLMSKLSSKPCRTPSPVPPAKRSKIDKVHFPSPDKEKQPDWLQSLSKSTNKDLKQIQLKQRPSAFRPWSPRTPSTEREKSNPQNDAERSDSKNQESSLAPNLTLTPRGLHRSEASSQAHSRETPAPGKGANSLPPHGSSNESSQQAALRSSLPDATNEDEGMDTDGEIDVDDCNDYPPSFLTPPPSVCTGVVSQTSAPQSCGPRPPPSPAPPEGPVGGLPGVACPELDSLRQMLYRGLDSKEAREKVLQEISRMQVKQEEKLAAALQAKRCLQQELEFMRVAKKGRLREAIEAKRSLRKEIERLHTDWERKMAVAEDSCGQLRRELECERRLRVCDKGCEASHLRAKYSTQMEELRVQLQQAEADREQLRVELQQEREARQNLEGVVKELQARLAQQTATSTASATTTSTTPTTTSTSKHPGQDRQEDSKPTITDTHQQHISQHAD
ncbi:unnamed protein product [Merluccius merluccius]